MFGFGKKKKEEENIVSDYDLLNSNDDTEEIYDDFGNPKYLKDGEDSFLNGTDDGDIESEEYLEEEEAVTEEYHTEDFINDDSENSDINEEEPEKKKGFFCKT